MKKETRLAVGIVAGVVILIAGWLWLGRGKEPYPVDIPEMSGLETPPIPAYDEYSDPDDGKDTNYDDQLGDVTRIIVRTPATTDDDIELDEVLAGKVIIDNQVVQQPGDE